MSAERVVVLTLEPELCAEEFKDPDIGVRVGFSCRGHRARRGKLHHQAPGVLGSEDAIDREREVKDAERFGEIGAQGSRAVDAHRGIGKGELDDDVLCAVCEMAFDIPAAQRSKRRDQDLGQRCSREFGRHPSRLDRQSLCGERGAKRCASGPPGAKLTDGPTEAPGPPCH